MSTLTKPGRVYALHADESKGEIRVEPRAARVWLLFGDWVRFPNVFRIEFDNDTDTGPATVHANFHINGVPMESPDDPSKCATVRFRAFARLRWITPDCPDPSPDSECGIRQSALGSDELSMISVSRI